MEVQVGVERVDYYSDQEFEQAQENEEACYRGWQEQQWAEEQSAKADYEAEQLAHLQGAKADYEAEQAQTPPPEKG